MHPLPVVEPADLDAVARQLGRDSRGVLEIAYRCPNGEPGVVKTAPRLPDGTPFPTLYYLTHPVLTAAASRLESSGLMREMTERLQQDPQLAAAYRRAHESYLAERDAIEPLGTTFSGGGMPERVKCLHVLIAHSLAKGPGVNPFGDEALAVLADEPAMAGILEKGRWSMSRVAAIDCGTNSIRLLIADMVDGRLRDVHREMRIVRLGQGVDATGQFAPDALARTKAALVDYAELLRSFEVPKVRMVATSAARDAANRDVFFTMTAEVLGAVVPGAVAEVITGTEEAALSFHGAIDELDPASAPFVVVDLGGGSTEVVLGDARTWIASFSADIGCVRLTERCLHSDPPTAAEIAAARDVVREGLGEALRVVPVEQARTWVGVAGTMTTLSALAQQMTTYDPDAIHLSRVGFGDLLPVCDELIAMTRQQRAALGPMHEGRVDVIGGGAIIVEELASALGTGPASASWWSASTTSSTASRCRSHSAAAYFGDLTLRRRLVGSR